jgi:F-type H+-transporting ATPase subunit delta
VVEASTIARPYAEAVFKFARERHDLEKWSDFLLMIDTVITDEAVLSCIANPSIDSDTLQRLLFEAMGPQLDAGGRHFVQILIENRRLTLIPHIRAAYEQLRADHAQVREARIVSALPLSSAALQPLIAVLEAKYRCTVHATLEIDSDLIGGARIEVGDEVIDGTVKARLTQMAVALAS